MFCHVDILSFDILLLIFYFASSIFCDSTFCFTIFCPESGLIIQTLRRVGNEVLTEAAGSIFGIHSLIFIAEPALTRHLSNAQLEDVSNAPLV